MLSRYNQIYPASRFVSLGVLGTRIIFSGFDTFSELQRAINWGVKDVCISMFQLNRWMSNKTYSPDSFDEMLPDDLSVVILDANDPLQADFDDESDMANHFTRLMLFLDEVVLSNVTCAIEPYKALSVLGQDKYIEFHKEILARGLPIFPVIYPQFMDFYREFLFTDIHSVFMMYDPSLSVSAYDRIFRTLEEFDIEVFVLGLNDPYLIQTRPWRCAIQDAWKQGTKWGTTFVFKDNKMRRYLQGSKKTARQAHKDFFISKGLDFDKIEQDVVSEIEHMNVLAWQEFAEFIQDDIKGAYWLTEEEMARGKELLLQTFSVDPSIQTSLVVQASEGIKDLVVRDNPGLTDLEPDALKFMDNRSIMGSFCDSCAVARSCPSYKPKAQCAYKNNAMVTNASDLKNAASLVFSMALERVKQARFKEMLEGNDLTPEVSKELKEVMGLAKTMKDLFKEQIVPNTSGGNSVSVTVAGQGGMDFFGSLMTNMAQNRTKQQEEHRERTINVEPTDSEDGE